MRPPIAHPTSVLLRLENRNIQTQTDFDAIYHVFLGGKLDYCGRVRPRKTVGKIKGPPADKRVSPVSSLKDPFFLVPSEKCC